MAYYSAGYLSRRHRRRLCRRCFVFVRLFYFFDAGDACPAASVRIFFRWAERSLCIHRDGHAMNLFRLRKI